MAGVGYNSHSPGLADQPMKVVLLSTVLCCMASAGDVTIVLDFQGPHSDRSIGEMKREFAGIMKGSGLSFDWRLRSEAAGQSFPNLVLVKFKGRCVLEPVPYLYDERGPLAFTYSTDGALQPFSEVACDKITASVRTAMFGDDYAKADLLFGRALGRVVAHELTHILRNSKDHDREGIAKPSLSGMDLISPDLSHK
jgi:hypothetical protein